MAFENWTRIRVHSGKAVKADIEQVEIIIVAKMSIIRLFMNTKYATSVLLHRGQKPFNRAPLDIPEILASATEEV